MFAQLKHKLQSQRGASLSMALMLFLVCTVVASIVIVAGSAVAGRLSQLRGMEKSYYNVTSAAKLLGEELKGDADHTLQVTVTRSKDGENWSTTINGKDGPYNKNNSTLFELLTCDLFYSNDAVHKPSEDLTAGRSVSSDQVLGTFDTSVTPPSPLDLDFTEAKYNAFDITPKGDVSDMFDTVKLTVKRNDNDTFSFTFTEEQSNDNPSPSVYTVVANVQIGHTEFSNSDTNPVWTNTVTWGYLYTIAGDA